MSLVMPQPPRCLECPHPVGPTGRHYVGPGGVHCRDCRAVHVVSMAMPWGMWERDFNRWLAHQKVPA